MKVKNQISRKILRLINIENTGWLASEDKFVPDKLGVRPAFRGGLPDDKAIFHKASFLLNLYSNFNFNHEKGVNHEM